MSVIPVGMGSSGGYEIPYSLRFRASNSAYLSRTASTYTNDKKFTFSAWVKRGDLSRVQTLFSFYSSANDNLELSLTAGDLLRYRCSNSGVSRGDISTVALFRDPTAHLHIVFSLDAANTTCSFYVNGSSALSTTVTTAIANVAHIGAAVAIGRYNTSQYLDGLLSEINFIDGQALTPSSFGETNSDGVWVPKRYTGTYGTNGFYLDFKDGSSTTALGYDAAGSNDWSVFGMSVAGDVNHCQMTDTPTNNYAAWNRLDLRVSPSSTFADANLSATVGGAASTEEVCATFPFPASTTSWVEVTCSNVASGNARVGIANLAFSIDNRNANGYLYQQDGQKYVLGVASAYGSTYTTADVIGILFDSSAGSITFYKQTSGTGNFVSQGAITGISTSATWTLSTTGKATVWVLNSGQRTFNYVTQHGSLPSSAKALCTANRASGSITTSGSFTGNASTDGTFVWLNGNPSTMTINGNAVTWGTHADKTAGGFKVRSSSASYNASGSNTYSVSVTGKLFGDIAHSPNTAQGNP